MTPKATTDELDCVGVETQLARLEERVEVAEERLDKHEALIEDRRRSNEGIRARMSLHETEDAREFSRLSTQLAANTTATLSIQRRAAWTIGLLVSLVAIGLSLLGLLLHR